ncbi:hypothetical protein Tco_1000320 [Tanacetum coccineum]
MSRGIHHPCAQGLVQQEIHDSDDDEDDDDDEGPSTGSNQGRSAKRRRPESAASRSAQPPLKDDDQSSKKPRESDASASKQHPALTSTGWQITDTRDAVVDSSMHRSDPNQNILNNLQMTFQGRMKGMSQIWRTLITLTFPRCQLLRGLSRFLKARDQLHLKARMGAIPPNNFSEPENNWANTYATTYQVPGRQEQPDQRGILCI